MKDYKNEKTNTANLPMNESRTADSRRLALIRRNRWFRQRYAPAALFMALIVGVTTSVSMIHPAAAIANQTHELSAEEILNGAADGAMMTEAAAAEVMTAEAPAAEVMTAEAPAAEVMTVEAPAVESMTAEAPASEAMTAEASTAETPAADPETAEAVPAAEDPADSVTADEAVLDPETLADEETVPDDSSEVSESETEVDPALYPAQNFSGAAGEVSVAVEADAGAFPQNTTMTVTAVNDQETIDKIEGAVEGTVGAVCAVDITFFNEEGQSIEPLIPIRVSMVTPDDTAAKEADSRDRSGSSKKAEAAGTVVVHLEDSGAAQIINHEESTPAAAGVSADSTSTAVQFDADSFSVYAVVYTVEFAFSVNGENYEFTLKGGDAISFADLADALGLTESYELKEDIRPEEDRPDEDRSDEDRSDEDRSDEEESDGEKTESSEEAGTFLEQVEKVTFSNPDLLWVGKIDEDTCTEALLFKHDLVPVYPAGTTANDYGEFATKSFKAPDWVLISLKPFSTTETLTVTMRNGKEIEIKVTDDADAVLIDDPNGSGKIVQTIANPSGTTIDLFDYWITDDLRYSQGMDGWPGHRGDAFTSYQFYWYNYNGRYEGNGEYTYISDSGDSGNYYVQNNHLRGNGNNQGINTNHVFKFYPGAAGTVVDYGDKGNNHRRGTNSAWTNNHDKYSSINSWTGNADPTTGLVQGTLNADGYPQLTNTYSLGTDGTSLSYLFDDSGRAGKQKYGEVNNLLYVDSDGYYTYDSRYYSADFNGKNGSGDNTFTLREHASGASQAQKGFWPFGDRVNWHGMHMTTSFSMPANGQVLNPKGEYRDMQFEFSGDDDTWLYVDGILVGDGGGIHNRTEIDINFATGLVTVTGQKDPAHPGTYVWTKYLDEIYRDAGRYNDYEWDGHTFKSGTYHKFEMFYLERGGSESNLYIHYNLVSTTDFTAHKSYHSEDNARLLRDQFRFELIGFDNTAYTNGFVPAVMPSAGNESGAGTVASPKKVHLNTAPVGLELPSDMTAHTSLITGVTEDGNVNFGNVQVDSSQVGKQYKYIVREVVPGDAENADGVRWDEASDEVKAEGGFVKDHITYDGRVYYFIGTVREVSGGVYELKKTRYTDATYTTEDTETKFFSFVNGYVKPITLKVLKKSDSGKMLSGAEFTLTRAMKNASDQWIVRQYQHNGETTSSEPKTAVTTEGVLTFDNLTEGHYILEETNPPAGYTKGAEDCWLLTLTKQDAADKIVLVPTIQALDENGNLTGTAAELTPDANNTIEHEVVNTKIESGDIVVEKKWLKVDGTSVYTDEELEEMGVDGTAITGELWRKKAGAVDEKFADFTLQKGAWSKSWTAAELYGSNLNEDWTYYFKNVTESPSLEDFVFTENPEINVAGTTTTYTYKNIYQKASVKITKVIEDSEVPLAGAEFTMTLVDSDRHVVTDDQDQPVGQFALTTGETGEITFDGLMPDAWYRLEETRTPAGYIKTEGPYYIYINEDGTGALDATVTHNLITPGDGNEYIVENVPGAALPNTGGSGTCLFTFLGVLLAGLAGLALLIVSKGTVLFDTVMKRAVVRRRGEDQ